MLESQHKFVCAHYDLSNVNHSKTYTNEYIIYCVIFCIKQDKNTNEKQSNGKLFTIIKRLFFHLLKERKHMEND